MGFEAETTTEGSKQAAVTADTQTKVGKTSVTGSLDGATTTDASPVAKPEERIKALAAQLERDFARKPASARQAAAKLSAEFPSLFSPEWLVGILRQIDAAAKKKQLIDQAQRDWDDKPGSARNALSQLLRGNPRDAKLRAWCTTFLKKIDVFQEALLLGQTFSTRPGDAEAHARRLHQLQPAKYTSAWLSKVSTGIWQFQDAAWAKKVSSEELGAWLGSNAVDWEEAPDEVKRELVTLLGRMKRDQAFSKGGGGATSKQALVAPTSDAQRIAVLDKADNVSTDFTFTKSEDIPAKRLEVAAKQESKDARELRVIAGQNQPQTLGGGSLLATTTTNPMLAILTKTFQDRARDLDKASAANKALAQRLRSGQTTLAKERQLIMADIGALELESSRRINQAAELEKAGNTEEAAKVRATLAALDQNVELLNKVIADPQGILPGAGKFDDVWGRHASIQAPSTEAQDISRFNAWVDKWTIGDDPYQRSVGRNINELIVGLERFTGRIQMVNAGVTRMLADAGTYFLPDSVTVPMQDYAKALTKGAMALKNAHTQVTSNNAEYAVRWERTMGELPLIERVFTNEKLAESPDNALFAVLGVLPQTKGIAVVAQFATSTGEAFFTSYATTGSLKQSLSAAGWAVLQNLAGLALAKVGASGALAGNLALVYGMGVARGQTRAQIEEQIAMTLIGAGIGAATGAVTGGGFQGIREKTTEIVSTLEGKSPSTAIEPTDGTPHVKPDPATSAKFDTLATELSVSTRRSNEIVATIASGKAQNTAKLTTELATVNKVSAAKRAELAKLFAAERTAANGATFERSTTIKTTTTDASVTPGTVKKQPLLLTEGTTRVPTEPTTKASTTTELATTTPSTEVPVTAVEPTSPIPKPTEPLTPTKSTLSVDDLIAQKIALRGEAWGNNVSEGTCAHVAMRNAVSARLNGLEAYILNISGLTNVGQWLTRFGVDPMGRIGRGLARLNMPTRGGHAIAAVRGNDGVWRFISWGQVELDWQTYTKRVFGPTGQIDGTFRLEDYAKWMVDNINLHNEPTGTSPLLEGEAAKAKQDPERTVKIGWITQ